MMRIRNSLDEKAKKFKKYLKEGSVGPGDVLVIAINGDRIPSLHLSDCMKRSLYGVGNKIVSLKKSTGEWVDLKREKIERIEKASGAEIGVRPFVDGSMDHVSAVLASWTNAFLQPSTLGGDFVLYPNSSCRNPWVRNLLPVAEEWLFEEDKDGWSGEKVSGTFSN